MAGDVYDVSEQVPTILHEDDSVSASFMHQ